MTSLADQLLALYEGGGVIGSGGSVLDTMYNSQTVQAYYDQPFAQEQPQGAGTGASSTGAGSTPTKSKGTKTSKKGSAKGKSKPKHPKYIISASGIVTAYKATRSPKSTKRVGAYHGRSYTGRRAVGHHARSGSHHHGATALHALSQPPSIGSSSPAGRPPLNRLSLTSAVM